MRKTLDDHVKKQLNSKPGPDSEISPEEDMALVGYAKYLDSKPWIPYDQINHAAISYIYCEKEWPNIKV